MDIKQIFYIIVFAAVIIVPMVLVMKLIVGMMKKAFVPLKELYGTEQDLIGDKCVLPMFFTNVASYKSVVFMACDGGNISFDIPKIGKFKIPLKESDVTVLDAKLLHNRVWMKVQLEKMVAMRGKVQFLVLQVTNKDMEDLKKHEFFRSIFDKLNK